MPIKELLAIAAAVVGGIFISHPLDFTNALHRVQFSILKEATRTDDWGNPSIYHSNRYTTYPSKIYRSSPKHKALQK